MRVDIYKAAIEARVDAWLKTAAHTAPTSEGSILVERIRSLVSRGGKRARPQLLRMTYEAYGGKDPGRLIDLGAALELHHQFLLVHDDIIDHDIVRYNGPNIVGYYLEELSGAQRDVAEAMGLLAGDLLFSFAHKIIIESESYTDAMKIALLDLINTINIDEAYGQQLDSYNVDPTTGAFSLERLTLIHTLKTARYSTQLPMQCAAILMRLDQAERKKIDAFALPFGVLFQLVDDFSDYFENKSAFNNRTKYRDYRQGKITHPLYVALTQSTSEDTAFLREHLGDKELSETSMHRVVSILEQSGARETCREYIETYFKQAHEALDALNVSPNAKQQFNNLLAGYEA